MALAQNQIEFLPHGWYVIRNAPEKDVYSGLSHEHHNTNEREFFENPPWNELSASSVGVESLMELVSMLSQDLTRRDLIDRAQDMNDITEDVVTTLIQNEAQEEKDAIEASMTRDNADTRHDVSEKTYSETGVISHNTSETGTAPQYDEKAGYANQPSAAVDGDFDIESGRPKERPILLWNAIIVACTLILTLTLMGLGTRALAQEVRVDGSYTRLALIIVIPPEIFISLVIFPKFNITNSNTYLLHSFSVTL